MPASYWHPAGNLPYLPHNILHDVPVPYRGMYNFKKTAGKLTFF